MKDGTLYCYSLRVLGNNLDQFKWFVKYGDAKYNFHKWSDDSRSVYSDMVWKYDVVKSKVVLGLYR
jgi:hypothetical protein